MGFVSHSWSRYVMLISSLFEGLVNYISSPGSSAFDHSLKLAESIAKNGDFCVQ